MNRVWITALLAAFVVAGSCTSGYADEPGGPPQGPFVVLVGVGEFTDPTIQARPTAEADARAMYDLFTDKAYFTAGAGQASTTLPMQIYSMIRFGVTPEINAMASIVMLVSFALVLVAQRLNHGRIPGA